MKCNMFYCYAGCRYAKCCFTECRGATERELIILTIVVEIKNKRCKKISIDQGQCHKTFYGHNLPIFKIS